MNQKALQELLEKHKLWLKIELSPAEPTGFSQQKD